MTWRQNFNVRAGPIGFKSLCLITKPDATNKPFRIASPFFNKIWHLQHLSAECLTYKHDAPQEDCQCGIHAASPDPFPILQFMLTRKGTDYYYTHLEQDDISYGFACLIRGGGKIIVHECGWRAETASIIALISQPETVPNPHIYRQRYGMESSIDIPKNLIRDIKNSNKATRILAPIINLEILTLHEAHKVVLQSWGLTGS